MSSDIRLDDNEVIVEGKKVIIIEPPFNPSNIGRLGEPSPPSVTLELHPDNIRIIRRDELAPSPVMVVLDLMEEIRQLRQYIRELRESVRELQAKVGLQVDPPIDPPIDS